ncbi:MAG: DUF58 domain-containing protein [Flavobacteriales bacterium]|nr:DUF58 domain-containing protein [Flavobacteriales bacterium]
MLRFIRSLYFSSRFFGTLALVIVLFTLSHWYPFLFVLAKLLLILLVIFIIIDSTLLYRLKTPIYAQRITGEKLSNGDENPIEIYIRSEYPIAVIIELIDEAPVQFQLRHLSFQFIISPGGEKKITYHLRPTKRGEYQFGRLNIFVASNIGLIKRRFIIAQDVNVPVYPSYIQMRKYELMAISNRLTMLGIKKIRKIGHNLEFDQIREYVIGDDYRTINWKATARKHRLMVNQYMDERAQPVYSLIDMGRVMKMPFNGMTLLDYSINASLVISNIAILRHDKAGLITFSHKTDTVLQADRKPGQMHRIMEILYRQKTGFLESSYELLYSTVTRHINQRSLLLLFTNFESLASMQRQLPYLRSLAKRHLLVVIFFRNTEVSEYASQPAKNTEQVYLKTIAEKFDYEKRQIVKELEAHGIASVLTAPEQLTVNTINKYLELKARGML